MSGNVPGGGFAQGLLAAARTRVLHWTRGHGAQENRFVLHTLMMPFKATLRGFRHCRVQFCDPNIPVSHISRLPSVHPNSTDRPNAALDHGRRWFGPALHASACLLTIPGGRASRERVDGMPVTQNSSFPLLDCATPDRSISWTRTCLGSPHMCCGSRRGGDAVSCG
jgi:hypothetical protein